MGCGPPKTPIFGDRDKTLHDGVNVLPLDRRYSCFNTSRKKAPGAYAVSKKAHPAPG